MRRVDPVARTVYPVTRTVDPVTRTVDPVARTVDPVIRTVDPVIRTVDPVVRTVDPLARTVDPLARTGCEPVPDWTLWKREVYVVCVENGTLDFSVKVVVSSPYPPSYLSSNLKFIYMILKRPVLCQWIYTGSRYSGQCLVLYRGIVAFYCENHAKLCRLHAEVLLLEPAVSTAVLQTAERYNFVAKYSFCQDTELLPSGCCTK
jgi:hypothetical protein